MPKFGRNAICPCGSGKKYKKCCLKKEEGNFASKMIARHGNKFGKVVRNEEVPGTIKMSEVILEYADELLDIAKDRKEEEKAIVIAITAWNLSLLDNEKRNQHFIDFINLMKIKINSKDYKAINSIIEVLIRKKQAKYPSINRFIVGYEFTSTKQGAHLNVVSTLTPDDR